MIQVSAAFGAGVISSAFRGAAEASDVVEFSSPFRGSRAKLSDCLGVPGAHAPWLLTSAPPGLRVEFSDDPKPVLQLLSTGNLAEPS